MPGAGTFAGTATAHPHPMRLTDTHIRRAKPQSKPYKMVDGGGLVLLVQPNGSKLWRRRLRVNGKETMLALGRYPKVGLEQARRAARDAIDLARRGINPAQHRKAAKARNATASASTFRAVAGEWLATKERQKTWTPMTLRQRRRLLDAYVFPKIGDLAVADIDSAVVYDVLEKIHGRAPAQTAFARQIISGVMQLAIIKRLATVDPVYVLRSTHRAPKTNHHRPLEPGEIGPFLQAVEHSNVQEKTRTAVRLAFWTLARSTEVIGAKWEEFDLEEGVWTIPAERMKKREEHRAPLPRQAVAALRHLKALSPGRLYLFPNAHDSRRPAARTFLNRAVTRLGFKDFSAHGIRATGSTMLHGMGFRSEAIERQLDHRERSKTKRAYNQADYLEDRRAMMQQWADFLDAATSSTNVTPMRRAVA